MKFRVGACALLVCLAGCSAKGPNSDFAELRGAAATKSAAGQLPKLQLGRTAAKSIANAPDRGALMSYQNKGAPTKREGAFTFYPVAISEDHALKAVATGEMSLPMPDGSQVKLKYERHDESVDGNWTWIGRVVGGDPQQEAIITFGEKAVFASIPQANGAPPLSIQTRDGALFAVQTDPSKVKSPNKGHNDMLVPAATALRKAAAAQVQAGAKVSQGAIAQAAPPTSANTVDVAIGYTAAYRAVYGSQSAATTRLTFLIQVGNQGYSNSVINGYLRLVSATEVAYTETNSNQTALHELTGSNGSAPSNVAIPAALTPLRTARDQNGADIAILVRDFQQPEQQGCGIAWLIGADQQEIVPASDAQWAYAVVSDGDDTGTDGHSYYCAPETLVHEASHLMGSAHDVANATNATGRYPYSYGYKTTNGNFFTIMAYGDDGQTPYRVFSNPNITTCGGFACGVANQADNARSLNQTIPVVAMFRATAIPFVGRAPRDFDGDGKSEVFWRNSTSGENVVWRSANQGSSYYAATVPNLNWKVVGSGDFDADGKGDIFWRDSATGQNIIWPSGSAAQLKSLQTIPDAGWRVVGVGDFNGDSKADVFWRHSSSGQNLIWWAADSNNVTFGTTVSTAWRVAGVGDFNGDGNADVFWRNSSTGENIIWPSGSIVGATSQAVISNQAWQIATVGDFNGDGKSDVFWKHSSSGETIVWPSGSHLGSNYEATVTGSWQVASSGDYNGDGRTDLFWYNATTGGSIVWWSAKAANSTGMNPVFTTWSPVL